MGSQLFLSSSENKVEGEKNDQEEKDPDRPEKALPNAIPMFLRVIKDPEGSDQIDQQQ